MGLVMAYSVKGRYYQRGVRFIAAEARIDENLQSCQIYDHDQNLLLQASFKDCSLDKAIQGLPRKLSIEGKDGFPYIFETDDGVGLENAFLVVKGSRNLKKFHGLTLNKWIGLIVASVVLPFFFWFSYPFAADRIAGLLPSSFFERSTANMLGYLDRKIFEPTKLDSSRQNQIRALFLELKEAGEYPHRLTLLFRDSSFIGANAMALPDGTMIITDDLIRLASNDDEIAGVIAHEMGHVVYQHGAKQYIRGLGLTLLSYFLIGDSSGFWDEVGALGLGLTQLSYGRGFELEADSFSANVMAKVGRDPNAMIFLLDKMKAKDDSSLLSSHPGLIERRKAVESGALSN